jgi:hypothetical protein
MSSASTPLESPAAPRAPSKRLDAERGEKITSDELSIDHLTRAGLNHDRLAAAARVPHDAVEEVAASPDLLQRRVAS